MVLYGTGGMKQKIKEYIERKETGLLQTELRAIKSGGWEFCGSPAYQEDGEYSV